MSKGNSNNATSKQGNSVTTHNQVHTNTGNNEHAPQLRGGPQKPQKPVLTRTSGGGTSAKYPDGSRIDKGANGRPTHYSNPGHGVEASFDRGGTHVTKVGPNGSRMQISRSATGERRIETTRSVPGGVEHMVSYGHNRGYYERPIAGRPGYVQRTVLVGGRSYGVVYHHYAYHGVYLYSPVPAVVFAPAFYGWMLTPWPAPFYYTPAYWGWAGQPWYGYYGPYFAPYPAYAGPDQWLTDYVIAANLQQAYADQQGAVVGDQAPPPPLPVTDEEKSLIDQDVKNELAREQQAAASNTYSADMNANPQQPASQVPEALQDHLFTVYAAPVEAKLVTGGTCNLSEGDMLFRKGDTPNNDNTVDVVVKASHADSSHPGLCAQQAAARVQLTDLQEMYNHKKELLAEGEQKQASLVGKKHGPKGPKANPKPVPGGQADPAESEAIAELKNQLNEADDTEKQVTSATGS